MDDNYFILDQVRILKYVLENGFIFCCKGWFPGIVHV
jgi:hypothetical protein